MATTNGIYQVNTDGKAPTGLSAGDQVVTGGGTYTITGVNADGTYTSSLTNANQTTRNYSGTYNTVSPAASSDNTISSASSSGTTSSSSSGSSSSSSKKYSSNVGTTSTVKEQTNGIYQVGADGKAPTGLSVGDQVVTGGGTYTIVGVNADGTYQSSLTNANQTTRNYAGTYSTLSGSSGQMGGSTYAPYNVNTDNNGLYKTGMNSNGVYKVGADGKAPAGLMVGDKVVTGGGIYVIKEVNADGSYVSEKTDDTRTTYDYDWPYDTVLGSKLNDAWDVQNMYSMLDWGSYGYDLTDAELNRIIQERQNYYADKGYTVGVGNGAVNVYDADGNVVSSATGGGLLDAYFGIPLAEIYLRKAGYSSEDISKIAKSVYAQIIRETGDDILNQLVEGYKSEGLMSAAQVGNERLYNDLNAAALAMTNRIRYLSSGGDSIDLGSPSTAAGAQTGYFAQLAEALLGEQQGWYHDLGLVQQSTGSTPFSTYNGGETLWKSAYDYAMDEMYKSRLMGDTERYTEMKDLANVLLTYTGDAIYDDGSVRSAMPETKTAAINKLLGTSYGIEDDSDWQAFLDKYGYYIDRKAQNVSGTAPYTLYSSGRYLDQDTKDQKGEVRDAYYQLLGTSLAEQDPNESYYPQLTGLGSVYASDLYKSLMGDYYSEPVAYVAPTASEIKEAATNAKYKSDGQTTTRQTQPDMDTSGMTTSDLYSALNDYYSIYNSDALSGDADLSELYNILSQSGALSSGYGTTGSTGSGLSSLTGGNGTSNGGSVLSSLLGGSSNGSYGSSGSYSSSGGSSDYSSYLADAYNNLLLSELTNLASSYQTDTANLELAKQNIDDQYYAARNEIAGTNETQRRAWQEYASAMGLNSGATGQAALTQSAAYQQAISDNANAQAAALQELEIQKVTLANQYNAAIIQAQADNNAELAQALYNEAVRAEEALAAQEQQAFSNMLSMASLAMDYSNAQTSASQSAAELQYKYAALAAEQEYQSQQAAYEAQESAWQQALAEREQTLAEQKYLSSLNSSSSSKSTGSSSSLSNNGYYSAGTSSIVLPGVLATDNDQSANTSTVDRSSGAYKAAYRAVNNLVNIGTATDKISAALKRNQRLTADQKYDIVSRLGIALA